MGMPHVYAEVCKNVASLGDFGQRLNQEEYYSKMEADPNTTDEELEKADIEGITKLEHRWKKTDRQTHIGNISGDVWEKFLKYKSGKTKTIEVNLLNSDQYADVGEQDWVVFGDSRKAVERFLKDFGIAIAIDKKAVVQQSI